MEQHISLSSRIVLAPRRAGLCSGQDNSVEVLVRIQAPDSPAGEARTRPPQAVSLVIDLSGSMAGGPQAGSAVTNSGISLARASAVTSATLVSARSRG